MAGAALGFGRRVRFLAQGAAPPLRGSHRDDPHALHPPRIGIEDMELEARHGVDDLAPGRDAAERGEDQAADGIDLLAMLASDLMARMQAARTQMALVIDEYGGTDGLVSLEDIVEMVVGDIEDEHDDDEEPMITETGDGVFVVDAKAEIDDVAEKIGSSFAAGEHGEQVDTVGGLIFAALGRIPARGEVVHAVPGFEFHVLDADPRRVKRVRIVPMRTAERRRRALREEADATTVT